MVQMVLENQPFSDSRSTAHQTVSQDVREKTLKRITPNNEHVSDHTNIMSDSTAITLSITCDAQHIEPSRLINYKCLEQLDIYRCENAKSIDLSALNGNQTLRIIRIINNGRIEHLVLPSGCDRLEELIITNNKTVMKKQNRFPETIPLPKDFRERSLFIQKRNQERMIRIQKRMILDLSTLDGSPRLRVFKIADNEFDSSGVILPEWCPNLEVVLLNETRVKEWRLVGCPKLRLIRLKTLSHEPFIIDIDRTSLIFWESQSKPPIIDITFKSMYLIRNIPERVKGRIVERVEYNDGPVADKRVLRECEYLLMLYGVIDSKRDGPSKDRRLLGEYDDRYIP